MVYKHREEEWKGGAPISPRFSLEISAGEMGAGYVGAGERALECRAPASERSQRGVAVAPWPGRQRGAAHGGARREE